MQFLLLPKLLQNYFLLAFVIICAAAGGVGFIDENDLFVWGITSTIVGLTVFLILFSIGALIQVVFASAEKGFIGKTLYHISDSGFFEETLGTETMTRWKSILGVYEFKNYLFVRINGLRIHMIPKREFSNDQEYESFCNEIYRFKNNA